MGWSINLVNNFKVEKVIFNCGLYNDLEKELIKVLDKKKIKYYSCIKELNIDKDKLYFLQTKEYDNEIKPKYSIISVGKNNRYGHPNKEVLDNLIDTKIYRTDQDGSIMFKIKNNGLKIESCKSIERRSKNYY